MSPPRKTTKKKAPSKRKTRKKASKYTPKKSRKALCSKDIPHSADVLEARERNKAHISAEDLSATLRTKPFAQLTPAEKDSLLEAVALLLGLVKSA